MARLRETTREDGHNKEVVGGCDSFSMREAKIRKPKGINPRTLVINIFEIRKI